MEKFYGSLWVDKKELSDLLKKGNLLGPVASETIEKKNSLFRKGDFRCFRAAANLAQQNEYDIIYSRGTFWSATSGGKGTFDFYKFSKQSP